MRRLRPWADSRRVRRAAAALAVATATATGLVLPPPFGTTVPAYAASCPTVKVIGVRGSGETQYDGAGYGKTVKSVVDAVRIVDPAADAEYVNYQALAIRWYDPRYYGYRYNHSVGGGITSLRKHIQGYLQTCHHSKLDLVGYSQGAQVVADTYLGWLSTAEKSRVDRIVLFGDPKFKGGQSGPVNVGSYDPGRNGIVAQTTHRRVWPVSDYGKVRSYCMNGDPVCNYYSLGQAAVCARVTSTCPHLHYMDWELNTNITYTLDASRFLLADTFQRCKSPLLYQPAPPYAGNSLIVDNLRVAAITCAGGLTIVGRYFDGSGQAPEGWYCANDATFTTNCRSGYQQVRFLFAGDAG